MIKFGHKFQEICSNYMKTEESIKCPNTRKQGSSWLCRPGVQETKCRLETENRKDFKITGLDDITQESHGQRRKEVSLKKKIILRRVSSVEICET